MSETQPEVKNPVQDKLAAARAFWQKADQKDRNKIIGGAVLLVALLAFPIFSSGSSGSICSRSETYTLAEEVYGNVFQVSSIGGAKEIARDKSERISTCTAALSLENGEIRAIKYTVKEGDNSIYLTPQLVGR